MLSPASEASREVANLTKIKNTQVVSTVVSGILFACFPTVEYSKGLVSIKKIPVEKESSHSKLFVYLCNSTT